MLSSASNILLLGTDHADNGQSGRSSDQHSDSMMLLRTDPSRHRLIYLSIPRDLRAAIPGYGESKINAAMQIGGPKLAIETVAQLTGLPINHVVVVDFGAFQKLIDAVGGIDVNVPENILSNRFDCPYTATRCQSWKGWVFHKGVQHMDGHQALIYSRIRENQLNPADTDFTRQKRQQDVMQQTLTKLANPTMFFRLPFSGGSMLDPLSTDLSTWQFIQLAWVKFRTGTTLHCRLGGRALGDGYITGDQENSRRAVRSRLRGRQPDVQVASRDGGRQSPRGGLADRYFRRGERPPGQRPFLFCSPLAVEHVVVVVAEPLFVLVGGEPVLVGEGTVGAPFEC